jgi:hypothetical protein
MNLQEKFWDIIKKPQTDRPAECEKIADDFAIGFGVWLHENVTYISKDNWGVYNGKWLTVSESLEMYKKEKGL